MFQRSRTSINVDNIIFRTPRKLVHSLQDTNNMNSDCSEKLGRRLRSLSLSDFEWSPVSGCDQNFEKALEGNSESVSSTNDIPAHADEHKVSDKAILQDHETRAPNSGNKKHHHRAALKLVFYLLFALVAVFTLLVGMSDRDEFDGHYLVPT